MDPRDEYFRRARLSRTLQNSGSFSKRTILHLASDKAGAFVVEV